MNFAFSLTRWWTSFLESWRPRAIESAVVEGKAEQYAVLVDGDNTQSTKIHIVFDTIGAIGGDAKIRLLFGDFQSGYLKSWNKECTKWSLTKIKTPVIVRGKSSVDASLMIEAMKLISEVDGFAIVSSDSDFTPLSLHLREMGKYVIGFGMKHTPLHFVHACSRFVYLDCPSYASTRQGNVAIAPAGKCAEQPIQLPECGGASEYGAAYAKVKNIIINGADESGWMPLSLIRSQISKHEKKALGGSTLTTYFKTAAHTFEVFKFVIGNGTHPVTHVRLKPSLSVANDSGAVSSEDFGSLREVVKNKARGKASKRWAAFAKLKKIIKIGADESGWMSMSAIGSQLSKHDREALGGSNFTTYFKSVAHTFEVSYLVTGNGTHPVPHVRRKPYLSVANGSRAVSSVDLGCLEKIAYNNECGKASKQRAAYAKLINKIKKGANNSGWTPLSLIQFSRPDREALGVSNVTTYFETAAHTFEVAYLFTGNGTHPVAHVRLKPSPLIANDRGAISCVDLVSLGPSIPIQASREVTNLGLPCPMLNRPIQFGKQKELLSENSGPPTKRQKHCSA